MAKKRVVVTGIGIISNNGCGKDEFWTSIVNGNTGIKMCSLFDASKLRT
jgi:3-oxoacyl-[acyl-carrier-protein] synthase II